jgi:hypothetical protein
VDFSVALNLTVAGIAEEREVNFKAQKYDSLINFFPAEEFRMANESLAIGIVRSCLERLTEGYLYGSDWKQSLPS